MTPEEIGALKRKVTRDLSRSALRETCLTLIVEVERLQALLAAANDPVADARNTDWD